MTVFIPEDGDADPDAEAQMQMGSGPENDLRDPWLLTDEGKAWLASLPKGGEG